MKAILFILSLSAILLFTHCESSNNSVNDDQFIKTTIGGDIALPVFLSSDVKVEKINMPNAGEGLEISGAHVYQLWDYKVDIIFNKTDGENIRLDLQDNLNAKITLTRTNNMLDEHEEYESISGFIDIKENKANVISGKFECSATDKDSSKTILMLGGEFKASL